MANTRPGKNHEVMKRRVRYVAARLFMEQGFSNTTVKQIAKEANINIGSLMNLFKSKEEILCELVNYIVERQFAAVNSLLDGITEDKVLIYAVEACLQLHIVEHGEQMRDVYTSAYTLFHSSSIVQEKMTAKLEEIFKEQLPSLETKDFYELEIATSGIMRAFMTVPCNIYFTMERKINRFLETTFKIYDTPKERIEEIISFVEKIDFENIAKQVLKDTLKNLEDTLDNA